MIRKLTIKEKAAVLRGEMPLDNLKHKNFVTVEVVDGRTIVRRDIRAMANYAIQKGEITIQEIADTLGIARQNLSGYLNGRVPLRERYLERLIWLIDDTTTRIEEDE